jgi:hypothetical protein
VNNVAADYVFMLVAAVHPLIRISQVSRPTQLVLVDVTVSPPVVEPAVVEPAVPPVPPPPPAPPRRPTQPSEPPSHALWSYGWQDAAEDDMAWCWDRPKDVWRSGNHGGDVA